MKIKRKIIEIDDELCNGCGQCVPSCAEGALKIVDGKARLAAERYCDGLGACLGECPTGALQVIEREAEDFDEEAVEEYLREKDLHQVVSQPQMGQGCPSARLQSFLPHASNKAAPAAGQRIASSSLTHWPVQIHLVPPTAPFLKGADLLVVSDCVPLAYPNLHGDFLPGKVVLVGCPKFDDVKAYIQKFADIFKAADIKRVTTLSMEVPCCSGLPAIVRKGLEASGKRIPREELVISLRGEILHRERCAA
jgi:NAD-dependent dihydropyrimidine dehydrogenase PreA subunit